MEEGISSQFLRRLDPDPERAEEKLLRLRLRIISYLERRQVPWAIAEELAQEAILAVIQQLAVEGSRPEEIRSLEMYIWGVAKNFLMRHWRTPDEKGETLNPEQDGQPQPGGISNGMEKGEFEQHREACVKRCLERVPSKERAAFLEYVQLEKHDEEKREALAAELGISLNYLYVKMHRLRLKLESCCLECMRGYGYELK